MPCDGRSVSGEAGGGEGALRARAELYLLHELVMSQGWPRHYSGSPSASLGRRDFERDEGRHLLQHFGGGVEALWAIGVLDEEEALAWCSRFLSAVEGADDSPQEASPDPAAAMRARRLLDERLARVAASASGDDEQAAISHFDEAIRAVGVAGALSQEEIADFQSRLAERASVEGWERFSALRRSPLPWQGTELERVVIGPPERHAGLAITHVELHADALVLHWHRVAAIELPQGREPSRAERARAVRAAYEPREPLLEVSDDLGTGYRSVQTGSPFRDHAESEDVVVRWGGERFRPAVPAQASELRVAFEETAFTLTLSP